MIKRFLILFLIMSLLLPLIPAPAYAAEEDLESEIRRQLTAYISTLGKPDASAARNKLINHALVGKGAYLHMEATDVFSVALINSNMMQINLVDTLAKAVLFSRSECMDTVYLGGGMAWYDGRMSFSNRVYPEPMDNIENTEDVLVSLNSCSTQSGWEFTPNTFDAVMVDVVGASTLRITLTRTEATPDTMTYHVDLKVSDDFDFNGSQNLGTIIGGWLTGTVIDTYSWDVTLDFSITVSNPCLHRSADYRWDFEVLDAVSYGTESTENNPLTKIQAVKEDGTLGAPYYEMERTVRLNNDKPWVMEIRMRGGGAVCIAKDKSFRENVPFLFKLGYRVQAGYPEKHMIYDEKLEMEVSRYNRHLYGAKFRSSGYSYAKWLTYRLENRVAEDGSNMVWLLVEGTEIGPMIHYEQQLHDEENGATIYVETEETGNWINGVDFVLNYIGTGNYKLFPGTELEFIQIWENGEGNAPYSYFETTTAAPTCTEPGKTVHTCSLCGASYTEETDEPALGHTLETLPATPATCETDGLTEGSKCTTCGEIVTAQEVIPALGHDWDEGTVTVPATCETDGEIRFTCNHDPSHTRVDTLTSPGHVPGALASCTEAQTCNSCGIELFSALGHAWNEGEMVAKPTPEADGLTKYTCTVCGETKEEIRKYEGPVRIAGSHRYETAFLAADRMKANLGIEKFDAVVVASGINFADALSGSYLAAVKNAPILLASGVDWVDALVKDYIKDNLNPGGTVYILGGGSAVPEVFEDGLDGFAVNRLAGGDRFETNLLVLEEAGVGDKPVLVCTGLSFADSLSASAAKLPILLVWNDLTDGQKALLDNLDGNKLYIIGGESAVSTGMEEQLMAYGETERVAGGNRFETSVAIAETFFNAPKSAVLAYAWNFPDGLCGGPLAATMDAPMILTMDKFEAKAAEYVQNWNIRNGTILGGEGLISEATVNNIFNET